MEKRDADTGTAGGWRGSRALWLGAARAAFLEGGLDAVKIQPLAAGLGLSRTSFYWFFDDRAALLDALLDMWDETNTRVLVEASAAYAETLPEAMLNVIGTFLDGGGFEARFDLAVRAWAHHAETVAARVAAADARRLAAIAAVFERFGVGAAEADVRARTVYLVQIGYISMHVREDDKTRMARIPAYVKTYAGTAPTDREMARFRARHAAATAPRA